MIAEEEIDNLIGLQLMTIIHEYSHCLIRLAYNDFAYFTPTSSQEDQP
jgi:hypothetical protein